MGIVAMSIPLYTLKILMAIVSMSIPLYTLKILMAIVSMSLQLTRWRYWWQLFPCLYHLHVEDTDGNCFHVYTTYTLKILMAIVSMSIPLYTLKILMAIISMSIPLTRWRYWWQLFPCLYHLHVEDTDGNCFHVYTTLHVEDTDGNCFHVYFRYIQHAGNAHLHCLPCSGKTFIIYTIRYACKGWFGVQNTPMARTSLSRSLDKNKRQPEQ